MSTRSLTLNPLLLSPPGVLQGLSKVDSGRPVGALLVAQMSCAGNLITPEYTKACVDMVEGDAEAGLGVGFISQSRISEHADLLHMTPGVNMASDGDGLSQKYVSVEEAVKNR